MDRQYLYVITATVAVIVLAYASGVLSPEPASTPATTPPAAGTKTLS